jgi:hypothetical protein
MRAMACTACTGVGSSCDMADPATRGLKVVVRTTQFARGFESQED